MKKLSKISLKEKLNKLDELSIDEQSNTKGGYKIYYPDYKNPNVSVDISPSKNEVGIVHRF